jgi:pyruvate dehydrogenase E2 component (dihydrolipoamide acetyltransferase)
MASAPGTVSCNACTRSYPWKPQYAGRKAKCKCGGSVHFPKDDPSAISNTLPAPDPAPQTFGEYDLHDPSAPTARAASHKPAPAAKSSSRRASKGNACIDCGKPLTPGAVLCMACGMNQQTGRKLDTSIEKPPMALAAELKKEPAKAPQKLGKWIGIGVAVLVLGAAAYVAMYVYPGFAVERAAPDSQPHPTKASSAVPPTPADPAPAPAPAASADNPATPDTPATPAPAPSVPAPPPG